MPKTDEHYESSDKWRYKILPGPWTDAGSMVKALNRFGDRGWELVQVDCDPENDNLPTRAYMKMLLDESPEEEPRETATRPVPRSRSATAG